MLLFLPTTELVTVLLVPPTSVELDTVDPLFETIVLLLLCTFEEVDDVTELVTLVELREVMVLPAAATRVAYSTDANAHNPNATAAMRFFISALQ